MPALRLLTLLLPLITSLAARWVRDQETSILAHGIALTPAQIKDSIAVGVRHPEKIRLQFVDAIPLPTHRLLQNLGRWIGLVSPRTSGITLRYGIYLRHDRRHDRQLHLHEFVHVAQYERLGSIENFLTPYLKECLNPGYPLGLLEQQAIQCAAAQMKKPAA